MRIDGDSTERARNYWNDRLWIDGTDHVRFKEFEGFG